MMYLCPVYMNTSQLVEPKDVAKILGGVRLPTGVFDSCSSWLRKAARGGLAEWVRGVASATWRVGIVPPVLKGGSG